MKTLYTVRKINRKDNLYGSSHGSTDANETICGKNINENWCIINNIFDGKISCRKCIKILKEAQNNS